MSEQRSPVAGMIDAALEIAVRGHAGQIDRQGEPYILHPLRVMHKVAKHRNPMITAAAVLHDVVEDCDPLWALAIRSNMPMRVIHLVELLTREHLEPRDRSYRDYIERLQHDSDAVIIKLADLNDNLFHPARRQGWVGHEQGKRRYLDAWFYLNDGVPWPKRYK